MSLSSVAPLPVLVKTCDSVLTEKHEEHLPDYTSHATLVEHSISILTMCRGLLARAWTWASAVCGFNDCRDGL